MTAPRREWPSRLSPVALLACAALAACGGSTETPSASVSPTSASLAVGDHQQFTATVTGTSNTAVTWSVTGGNASGTLSSATANPVTYTAPGSAGTYFVVATSAADSTKTATATVVVQPPGTYITPSPVTGDVTVAVDSSSGTMPISPWIFGLNAVSQGDYATPAIEKYIPATRLGGNATTAYNWEINYYNAGADFGFTTGHFGNGPAAGSGPGGIVASTVKSVYGRANTMGNAALITIPVVGYAPGTLDGADYTPPTIASRNAAGVPVINNGTGWRYEQAYRTGDATHALATATPDLTDTYVYQDDFLTWFKSKFPGHETSATEPIFFEMDNEPDDWGAVQQEVRGWVSAASCPDYSGGSGCALTGFDELINKTIPYARTVKDVMGQQSLVFGPAMAGWYGDQILGYDAGTSPPANPDGTNYGMYLDYYLQKMKAAEATYGKRILDVLDVHMYPDSNDSTIDDSASQTAAVIDTREQSPRMFWDPSFYMSSWIETNDAIPVGSPNTGCVETATDLTNCARQFIPRFQQMIARSYPGTKLAFTEWNWNRGDDMSNAIATADTLGIFARHGLFFSTMFPTNSGPGYSCTLKAYGAFVSYDGAGAHVGATYIPTTPTDPSRPAYSAGAGATFGSGHAFPPMKKERITAYATFDPATPQNVKIVAINKDQTSASLDVGFAVKHTSAFGHYDAWQVSGGVGSCAGPVQVAANVPITAVNAFNASLPKQSITVFVLKP